MDFVFNYQKKGGSGGCGCGRGVTQQQTEKNIVIEKNVGTTVVNRAKVVKNFFPKMILK